MRSIALLDFELDGVLGEARRMWVSVVATGLDNPRAPSRIPASLSLLRLKNAANPG